MSKFRMSAKGEECLVRIPSVCNHNPETTVLAHLPDGTGGKMGGKSHDLCSVYACSACHDEIDNRTYIADVLTVLQCTFDGHMRTLNRFIQKGLINA